MGLASSAGQWAMRSNSMRFIKWAAGCLVGLLVVGAGQGAFAADAYPLFTDINQATPAFGNAAASAFGGLYTLNSTAKLNGNDVLSINQKGQLACCHGTTVEVNISNGENGVNSTQGGANVDIPNATPANPVFAAIGNASGKL